MVELVEHGGTDQSVHEHRGVGAVLGTGVPVRLPYRTALSLSLPGYLLVYFAEPTIAVRSHFLDVTVIRVFPRLTVAVTTRVSMTTRSCERAEAAGRVPRLGCVIPIL